MCGRYTLHLTWAQLRALMVGLPTDVQPNLQPRYNIRPGEHEGALVALKRDGQLWAERLKWGFRPKAGAKLAPVNAKAETLFNKWPWKQAATHRRCAVLMDGFFEPMGPKPTKRSDPPRRQFYFRMASGGPFLVAGVWTRAVEEGVLDTFALITTEPNEVVAPIHSRMPAILDAANLDTWLGESKDVAALQALLAPWMGEPLETYEVDAAKVNARDGEGPECIEPLDEVA